MHRSWPERPEQTIRVSPQKNRTCFLLKKTSQTAAFASAYQAEWVLFFAILWRKRWKKE